MTTATAGTGAPGPFESWLAGLLTEAAAPCAGLGATVASVDLSAPSKLGEARATMVVSGPGDADRSSWDRLADVVGADPRIDRVVVVPPTLYITLAPGVLEDGVARCADESPLIPQRSDARGIVVVFCSPNTNKPLHIGHLRACFLGMSISRLLEETGARVARSQMLSNFGIHMCQALAVHDGALTPQVAGLKGDHFVGQLYRAYHDTIGQSAEPCDGLACREHDDDRPCARCRASDLLRRMAGGDAVLLEANRRMGEWAIEGVLETQGRIGTTHDSCLRESEVIAIAVEALDRAVDDGVCMRRPDGSTCIPVHSTGEADLTLLRSDGTSLVFSMLLGIYITRGAMYPGWRVLELTGEQWRAGRTAMYEVLDRLGRQDLTANTEGAFFGMVRAGGEVMRSRSGAVVVADELIDRTARRVGAWSACPDRVRDDDRARDRLAVALLKYHVLRFPRPKGFDFDEDSMWSDATTRLGAVGRALDWVEGPSEPGPCPDQDAHGREVRALALALARQSAFAGRALERRDPAVLVRYVDDVADKGLALARRGVTHPDVQAALSSVLRRSLMLLGIDFDDLGRA